MRGNLFGRPALTLFISVALGACSSPGSPRDESLGRPGRAAAVESARADELHDKRPRIVVLGDSLTAGLGLQAEEAYPALLQQWLEAAGYALDVVNAGVSGDTTAGGLRRLAGVIDGDVRLLIVALGGNDGLRGLPVDQMKQNVTEIIERATDRGIRVLLAGMEAPPNFGITYTAEFRQAFLDIEAEHDLVLVPFLLEGVAGVPELNQSDHIHPNAEGAKRIAAHLWTALVSMLAEVADAQTPQ